MTLRSEPVVIEAKRSSICGACEEIIFRGDRITPDPLDGAGAEWVHAKCPQDVAPRPVCTVCFMEIALNGECAC